ncbi:MAG: phospho-N-acetylmuramoyl-pentapeptide-transferase [Clostridia bacterium]|nr:phospho-N-acetylmuramoyl-pentapeptide-transferase [Clostridia bacterium]
MNDYIVIAITAAVSFVFAVILGKIIIPKLVELKMGQSIKEIGPNWHLHKQGTPVMGGLIFIFSLIIACAVAMAIVGFEGIKELGIVLFPAVAFGAVGFLDDYEKIAKKQNLGLNMIQKLVLQFAVTAVFLTLLRISGYSISSVYIPFFDLTVSVSPWIYCPLAALFIALINNAANLTDGVDGLASGVTLPIAAFLSVTALLTGHIGTSVITAAIFGGLVGFLVYNYNPAKVFMGDTGSLFIGGLIAGAAFAAECPLILIVCGFVYLAEAASVVLQVGYFKLSHGKRIFKMAPIHHHFEMCGWKEKKVFWIFTLVSTAFCALSVAGVYKLF